MKNIVYKFYENSIDGELIEEVNKDFPIDLNDAFPSYFIKQLDGKDKGDTFSFLMSSKDGFGEIDASLIQELPSNAFLDGNNEFHEEFIQGNFIEIIGEDEIAKLCIILEISDTTVKLDFNHPLAGVDIYVKGEII